MKSGNQTRNRQLNFGTLCVSIAFIFTYILGSHACMNNTSNITAQALTGSFQALFKLGGFKSYQILVIVANAISKALFGTGLKFATNAALTRIASVLTGPIGWIITGLWTAVDIAGPAYRITIPAVFAVATLRLKSKANEFNF